MTTLRLCVCLLVLGTLFVLGGCHKHVVTPRACDVHISSSPGDQSCTVSQKEVWVKNGGQLCWQADAHDYTIQFNDPHEPSAPFKVNRGTSSPGHVMQGHTGCDDVDQTLPPARKQYKCKYSVTRDSESKPCADFNDPVVHIMPG